MLDPKIGSSDLVSSQTLGVPITDSQLTMRDNQKPLSRGFCRMKQSSGLNALVYLIVLMLLFWK